MKPKKLFPRSPPDERGRSRLLEFLAIHAGLGAAVGIAIASGIVLSDFARIGTLLRDSSEPYIPMILFFASFALTFASLKIGIAVMSLPLDPPDEPEEGDGEPPAEAPSAAPEDGAAADDPKRLLGRRE